jgi:hypothetical protein
LKKKSIIEVSFGLGDHPSDQSVEGTSDDSYNPFSPLTPEHYPPYLLIDNTIEVRDIDLYMYLYRKKFELLCCLDEFGSLVQHVSKFFEDYLSEIKKIVRNKQKKSNKNSLNVFIQAWTYTYALDAYEYLAFITNTPTPPNIGASEEDQKIVGVLRGDLLMAAKNSLVKLALIVGYDDPTVYLKDEEEENMESTDDKNTKNAKKKGNEEGGVMRIINHGVLSYGIIEGLLDSVV